MKKDLFEIVVKMLFVVRLSRYSARLSFSLLATLVATKSSQIVQLLPVKLNREKEVQDKHTSLGFGFEIGDSLSIVWSPMFEKEEEYVDGRTIEYRFPSSEISSKTFPINAEKRVDKYQENIHLSKSHSDNYHSCEQHRRNRRFRK
jgi:hypothetical protein